MTKARGLLIVGLLLCAKPGFAGVISLDGVEWQTIGLASVAEGPLALPPDFPPPLQHTVGPTGGNDFWGLLESGNNEIGAPPSGNASASDLETFFGMTAGFLTSRNYTSGSGMVRDFTLAAGDQVTFDWTFVTSELEELAGRPDAAMFVLDGDGDVLASAPLPDGTTQALDYQAFMALTAGTYSIGVAVLNSTDSCCSSYLGVDDFKLNGTPIEGLAPGQPVPEPTTLLLLTAGWGTAVAARRLRRRQPTV